jgi:hypothetical protein
MVNINYFDEYVWGLINKVQAGMSITPDQKNIFYNQAQLIAFEQDYGVWVTTKGKELSQFLQTFLKKKEGLNINSQGVAQIPSDYQHTASMRSYWVREDEGAALITVDAIANVDWGDYQISSLEKPSRRFPKFTEYPTTYEFLPKNLGFAFLDYFKTPQVPFWNFEIIEDTEVYTPTGSVNFEWDEFALNRIAGLTIELIGGNLMSKELIALGQGIAQQSTQQ